MREPNTTMPYRAGKIPRSGGTGILIPRRLIFSFIYNDILGIGIPTGLIFRRRDMVLSSGIEYQSPMPFFLRWLKRQ